MRKRMGKRMGIFGMGRKGCWHLGARCEYGDRRTGRSGHHTQDESISLELVTMRVKCTDSRHIKCKLRRANDGQGVMKMFGKVWGLQGWGQQWVLTRRTYQRW
jgi:hypothetical protein